MTVPPGVGPRCLGRGALTAATLALLAFSNATTFASADEITPILEIEREGNVLTIRAAAAASNAVQLRGTLLVERSGPSGHARTLQSTDAEISPGNPAWFAIAALSLLEGEIVAMTLTLESPAGQVATLTRVVPAGKAATTF